MMVYPSLPAPASCSVSLARRASTSSKSEGCNPNYNHYNLKRVSREFSDMEAVGNHLWYTKTSDVVEVQVNTRRNPSGVQKRLSQLLAPALVQRASCFLDDWNLKSESNETDIGDGNEVETVLRRGFDADSVNVAPCLEFGFGTFNRAIPRCGVDRREADNDGYDAADLIPQAPPQASFECLAGKAVTNQANSIQGGESRFSCNIYTQDENSTSSISLPYDVSSPRRSVRPFSSDIASVKKTVTFVGTQRKHRPCRRLVLSLRSKLSLGQKSYWLEKAKRAVPLRKLRDQIQMRIDKIDQPILHFCFPRVPSESPKNLCFFF